MCPTSHDVNDLSELKEEVSSQDKPAALDRTVWRKLDIWILPLCTAFFLLSAVDRTNIANARVAGLQTSLGISNYQARQRFVLYVVTQFPATLLFKYVGPNLMIPAMAISWGLVCAAQGFVHNYSGLLACRIFLGLVEGGLPPGIILYLSFFYPRKWLQIRIAVFNATTALASAFSGLLAAAIDQLQVGGRPGWAWIFILEGIFTIVFGAISYFLIPCSPKTASFLTEKERAHVVSALKYDGSVSEVDENDKFNWREIVRAAKSPHVWCLAVMSFLNGTLLLGLVYFEPQIVVGLGYTGNRAQLMSVPPFAVTFVVAISTALVSDRYQCRGYTVIFLSLLNVIGFTMFYVSTSNRIRYISLFFAVSGTLSTLPALMTWVANNSTPHTRRATAVAIFAVNIELGGILATWLLGSLSPAPNYTSATITFIVMSILLVVFSTANLVYLSRENRLKAERRLRMTKEEEPEDLGDRSAWFIYKL
ncbi:major facilitator superfamily domain-containing protein [Boletus edulis]|nr:major facilitator superfamily domain-containing protein [Boletus edulis]